MPEADEKTCKDCAGLEGRVEALRIDMEVLNLDKERRLTEMHSDLLGVRNEVGKLAEGLARTNEALTTIAENTTIIAGMTNSMSEMVKVYDNFKGFGWVLKNLGYWAVLALGALVGALVAANTVGAI